MLYNIYILNNNVGIVVTLIWNCILVNMLIYNPSFASYGLVLKLDLVKSVIKFWIR